MDYWGGLFGFRVAHPSQIIVAEGYLGCPPEDGGGDETDLHCLIIRLPIHSSL